MSEVYKQQQYVTRPSPVRSCACGFHLLGAAAVQQRAVCCSTSVCVMFGDFRIEKSEVGTARRTNERILLSLSPMYVRAFVSGLCTAGYKSSCWILYSLLCGSTKYLLYTRMYSSIYIIQQIVSNCCVCEASLLHY